MKFKVSFGVWVWDWVGVEVATGSAAGLDSATPLDQISFLPDLMQVNFLPAEVAMEPTFLQVVPAFTAENAGVERAEDKTISDKRVEIRLFIYWGYSSLLDLSVPALSYLGKSL